MLLVCKKSMNMIHNPVNDQLESTWKWMYEGINRANYLVENKDKVDFTRKSEFIRRSSLFKSLLLF